MKPIVIVQHEQLVPPGSITDVLTEDGIEHHVFEAWRDTQWPELSELEALVVMGGTMNVDQLDDYPFLGDSRRLIADALEHRVPTLGVCLGSQMMARVLDADVYRAAPRNATFSGLKLTTEGSDDPVIEPFADGIPVLQFHEDTFRVPESAVALATSESSGLAQAFRYGDNAYAIQFHFEVDKPILDGWMNQIGPDTMRDDWGVTQDELSRQAVKHIDAQQKAGRELFRRFIKRP